VGCAVSKAVSFSRMPRVPLIFDPEGDDGLSADLLEEE
jgi:hypothetical protein